MCVAAIGWHPHPAWQLVVIGNRDEFHARPAAPLARWDNGILAGRDLAGGGTWLGVAPEGRFVIVTNRRAAGFPRAELASRGDLVTSALLGRPVTTIAAMNPFNLFRCDADTALIETNFPQAFSRRVGAGIHGLANGAPEDRWDKTRRLEAALAGWIASPGPVEALLAALADRTPDPADADNRLSAPFIADPVYGTRASTVVLVDAAGRGRIVERSFAAGGELTATVEHAFAWPARPLPLPAPPPSGSGTRQ